MSSEKLSLFYACGDQRIVISIGKPHLLLQNIDIVPKPGWTSHRLDNGMVWWCPNGTVFSDDCLEQKFSVRRDKILFPNCTFSTYLSASIPRKAPDFFLRQEEYVERLSHSKVQLEILNILATKDVHLSDIFFVRWLARKNTVFVDRGRQLWNQYKPRTSDSRWLPWKKYLQLIYRQQKIDIVDRNYTLEYLRDPCRGLWLMAILYHSACRQDDPRQAEYLAIYHLWLSGFHQVPDMILDHPDPSPLSQYIRRILS